MRLLDMRTFFLEIITQKKSNSLGVLRFQCTDVSFISSVSSFEGSLAKRFLYRQQR